MRKTILAALLLFAATNPASAGGQEGEIGVGAEFGLNGQTGGLSANYDAGKFHFGGFLGMFDPAGDDNLDFTFGARFYYHIHSTAMSDFGIGGLFGMYSQDQPEPAERNLFVFLEPGLQIRLFLASNVALSFGAGISIGLADADGVAIGGGIVNPSGSFGVVNATAGVHYYFF
jgi:hypothetical protein